MQLSYVTVLALLGQAVSSASVAATKHVRRDDTVGPYKVNYYDQPIDHFPQSDRYRPHTKGTFKQRYLVDSTYYKPGAPIYLYIGGETDLASRVDNLETGIIQILMKATNGLGIILESRYYGESHPFNDSTTDNLAYLTTEQTIADNEHFARNVKLLVNTSSPTNAPAAPWVLYGGSLAGAQTAFSIKQYPETLYGGIASSGVIDAVLTYPQWYNPIQNLGPQDCIASVNAIIDKYDRIRHDRDAARKFRSLFGLEALQDDRDVAMTIAFPIGGPLQYPLPTWQELNWNSTYGSNTFFEFCGNVTDINAPESQRQVDYALSNYTRGEPWTNLGNYAAYFKRVYVPLCTTGDINSAYNGCFGTQDPKFWANTTNTDTRSYLYQTCTEGGFYQAAPKDGPRLLSDALQDGDRAINYTQSWCKWAFPAGRHNEIPGSPDLSKWLKYGGLNLTAERLFLIDGSADVWNDVCYHSSRAPPRSSSIDASHPELLINGAGHHWDSYGILDVDAEPQYIREAHKYEIRSVQQWLRDFPKWKPKP